MDVLKVFVNGGTNTGTTLDSMVEGDIFLVKASDNTRLTAATGSALANSVDVRVAARTSKGIMFSTPFNRSTVSYVNYKAPVAATQKVVTTTLADIANDSTTYNKTYTLGIQIKEDLRMGTYNKNTEILATAVTPSTAYSSAAVAMKDITSQIAKGFAANPLTSTSPASISPSPQLVKVERTNAGTVVVLASSGATLAVTQGSKVAVLTHGTLTSTPAVGSVLSISGKVYLIEAYDTISSTVKRITLDTAYQGASAAALSANTSGAVGVITTTSTWAFVFTGIVQPKGDRFSQFRMVDYIVTYPKGFDVSGQLTVTLTTAPVQPIGSWKQVRQMEETAFTNTMPLINYREFPFEDFSLNVNLSATTATYAIFTLVHSTGGVNSYNFSQSNYREFPQTTVCAVTGAEAAVADDGTDADDTFANALVGWYGASAIPATGNVVFGDTTF